MGLLGTEALLCPPISCLQEVDFSLCDLPWVPRSRFKHLPVRGRERMQRQGRSSQGRIVQPWGRSWLPSRDAHSSIFESSAELNSHQMEDVNYLMKHSSFQRKSQFDNLQKPQKPIRRPPGARLKECRPCRTLVLFSNLALELLLKTLCQTNSLGGDRGFLGRNHLWPPLPGRAIRPFFSASPKTLISEIQSGIGAQSPTFSINTPVSGY